ncbi:MAG: hypothetical protein ACM3JI_01955 [Anaerolineae bacterium]
MSTGDKKVRLSDKTRSVKSLFSFWLIRFMTWPIALLPYHAIHRLGKIGGFIAFYLLSSYRKRCLSNLSLATDLHLTNEEIRKIAIESMQNLLLTCLEYAKLAKEKKITNIAVCENPAMANKLIQGGTPPIFFCGHQANWEVLFLEGSSRMPGVAIGRPVKNKFLYDWIVSIREKFGGKIIKPQNAIREGLRALKKGAFLGIVGDQGMPNSGFSSDFFGRLAWTSPIPAILAYRTGCPILVASTIRKDGAYVIHYSDPIWPRKHVPMEQEIDHMMKQALHLLEESIKQAPGQWLWSHNRWKQQTPEKLKKKFRYESILIILPKEDGLLDPLLPYLESFREIYPLEFITLLAPHSLKGRTLISAAEQIAYSSDEELFVKDFRFKLIFNFSKVKNIRSHFLKLSAFEVFTLKDLRKIAHCSNDENFDALLKKACRRPDAL